MSDMDAYRDVFLAESTDFIQQITDGLLALEQKPSDLEPVEVIFRGAHSLKGMAAAMGYEGIADLTHKMETLMDRVRKGELSAGQQVIDLMLKGVDRVRELVSAETAGLPAADCTEIIESLELMSLGGQQPEDSRATVALETPGDMDPSLPTWRVRVLLDDSCVLKAVRAYMVIKRLTRMGSVISTVPGSREIEDEQFDREFEVVLQSQSFADEIRTAAAQVSEIESVAVVAMSTAPKAEAVPESRTTPARTLAAPKLSETQTVRVSIGHLDTLVDLVGELIILRSRLERIASDRRDPELVETMDELQRVSTDLQYEVMQTRMVPVGNIFNRFPRMVRDLALDLDKKVQFQMSGLDIELDRTVLDEIGDPLVHLLRNSIDHGIESPPERSSAGKSPVGRITLSASRERDHVAIEVADDGKGISCEQVWKKAVERGYVEASAADEYDEREILLLTCLPGFSTTDAATKVSGRGVGMDAVKGKIEYLGGTIEIRSEPGEGTSFVMRLPLTLAIVHALLLNSNGQSFAMPLSVVEEVYTVRDVRIETIDGMQVLVMRDEQVVPIHRLDSLLFGAEPNAELPPRSSIVMIRSGQDLRALHVDSFGGRTEIVVKPLSDVFRDTRGFSGATVLGDGRVLLIIDPRSVFTSGELHR